MILYLRYKDVNTLVLGSFCSQNTLMSCNIMCYTRMLFQSGASPLMIASQCGMLEVVRVLLRFHARVDVFDEVNRKR